MGMNTRVATGVAAHQFLQVRGRSKAPLDVVKAFNATERQFGEHADTSSHVAVIQMMMMTFGPALADLFSEVRRAGSGHDVTLKDGYKLHVSDQELHRTAVASKFVGNNPGAMETANFALAVFIKRKQLSSTDSRINTHFDTALSTSLQGETVFNLLKGMGMNPFVRQLPTDELAGKGTVGVMAVHDFGASLIRNGVAHRFGREYTPSRPYVYVLETVEPRSSVLPQLKHRGQNVPVAPVNIPLVDTPSNGRGEKRAEILDGFNAVERGFNEVFDVSSHASVIKLMMMRFGQGATDMFESVIPAGAGFDITMKDGFELHLSGQELQQMTGASRFAGSNRDMVQQADFMLAAYTKRKQMTRADLTPGTSFEQVLSSTLKGDTQYNVLKGMGMTGFLRIVSPARMQEPGAVAVVSTSGYSSALVLDGVQHSPGNKRSVGTSYGYMLAEAIPEGRPIDSGLRSSAFSDVAVGIPPANIWSGFYQGVEGNCVTVSAIKAAMLRYGQSPRGIYKNITETREGYTVTLRDSSKVNLTHAELKQAREGSNLKGPDAGLLKDANFLYAVSAKRAQMENHEFRAGESFEVAMSTLNDGEVPGDALRRLGLYAFTRRVSVQALANGATGTLANFGHSVVVKEGFFDYYGSKIPLKASSWMRDDGDALMLV
ncbi:hypothetical protein RGV33_10845 [Pseudomonas sp. Bout1]|uniref:hypothetical protein n=1 Tax=Pseudomonas sp. Bout1 TaxID=3048600 RepID=UPI002AB546E5|nr:hypothetical protein [Pseudomonas sp. Bout1]MDY7532176.1 hypothetical protein [Pseudomonas sp. Bout1]MEB0188271.1 hypothetical protein [Pseudomonas sp. Bout1]